jgi:hypothetical protein
MRDKRTSSGSPPSSGGQGLPPVERTLRARLAAHSMHAKHDARDTTANGRTAFLARFEAEVDPDGILPPEERRRRAEHARSAYFTRLALAAVKARRRQRDAEVIALGGQDLQELIEEVTARRVTPGPTAEGGDGSAA